MKRPFLLLAFLPLAGIAIAQAVAARAPRSAAPATHCSIPAWSIDRIGLKVRAGPSRTARVVGRLARFGPPPGYDTTGGREIGSGFEIVASRNGWFYVRGHSSAIVALDPESSGEVWMPLEGWISGAFVRFSIQSEQGFERPDPRSRLVWSGRDERSFDRLLDCSGEFAHVGWREGKARRSAWFRGICGSRETSCDGAGGDWLDGRSKPRAPRGE